jgi:putative phage-type endonuclease
MAMKVVDLRQRSKQWLDWRREGVTATSAAVLVGANPDKTIWRLWAEQVGKVVSPNLSVIPQVRIAMMLEPHALAWFEQKYDLVLLTMCGESSKYPVIRASFDGLTEFDEPVEVKILSDSNFLNVMEFLEESHHYKLYWWQVQHQLLVSEGKRGFLVFYHTRYEPIVFEIARDETAIAKLVKVELEYWESVKNAKEPLKDPLRDYFQPEGDALKEWVLVAAEMRELEAEKIKLTSQAKAIVERQSELQNSLLKLMGQNMLADCEGIRMTRYMQSGRTSWKEIVMMLDPDFSEAKYPNHVSGKSERLKVTIDEEAPISAAALAYVMGGVDAELVDFCV